MKGTWIGDNNFFGVLGGYSYKYGDDVSLPGVYGQHSSYTGAARGGLGVIRNILWSFGVWGKGLTAGGYFSSANGTGVLGKSTGTGGIFGAYNSNSTTDKYYGVAGVSVAGNGVYGEITSDTFSSEWKAGVYGKGGAKTSGVMGYTTTDKDNAAAIVGINPKGYGGDFTGKNGVKINGPLEVSGGIQGKGLHWAEKGITASNFFTKTSIGGYYYHKMIKHIYVTFPYSGYALVQASGIFSNNDESFSQMSAQITDNEYLDPDGKNFIIDGSVAVVGLTNPTGQGFYPSFPFASSRVFGVEGGKSYHFHLIGFLKTTKSDVKFNFDGALNCMFFSRKY
ncbi:hypothetical protein HZC34_06195 [Candidatus Saganbacteria bacterium]|nr:hypothetical protein [Candidatus Saganbacteria bacterium]